MNVSALARQLKITTNELLEKLPELGFDIGARAIKVDDKLAPKIIEAWKKAAKKDRFKKELSKVTEIRGQDKDKDSDKELKEISIGDTVKIISEIMGVDVKIISDEQRIRPKNSEVERLWADNSKAKQILGWEPRYSGLEGLKKGITKTVEWFSNEPNMDVYKSELYNI